jgi:DNA invertase Pin-like site-specific DNA recombinase
MEESAKAVIYARFSSDKQREESIDGQIRECTAYAESQNLEVIGAYIDRALSARSDNRPDFLRMIADSARKTFQYVIVYQLDRFSRSRYDSAIYKNKLKKNGVRVLSAKEHIGDDPSSIILESMLEGYAEYYSAELSQKVKRGMTENILEGKWVGCRVSLGYKLTADKKLQIVPRDADAVRLIYKMYNSNERIIDIVRYLNAHRYKTAAGRTFNRSSLTKILGNKIYIGTYTWDGHVIEHFAPPILADGVWEAAQKRTKQHKQHPRPKRRSADYALTGLIYCGECGNPMTGQSGHSKNGSAYHYYRCSTKNNYHSRGKKQHINCKSRNISREKVEDLVLDATVRILSNPKAIKLIAKQAADVQRIDPTAQEQVRIAQERKTIQAKLENSIAAVEKGLCSKTIAENIERYESQISELDQKIDELKFAYAPIRIDAIAVEFFLKSLLDKKKDHDKYRLDMFRTFIRQVIIYSDKVEIRYNYTNCPPILKNPVSIALTGSPECSDKAFMVHHIKVNANIMLQFYPDYFASCISA